jgi:hypothetical protein
MASRRIATVLVLLGAAVGGAGFWRRRSALRDHVDLYFADGSMVSFGSGSPVGNRLFPLARRMLAAARG